MSEVSFILISAFCLSVPLGVKYLIAFQTRHLLNDLKGQEREVERLVSQAEALESQGMVMRRAVDQVGSQYLQAQIRGERLKEKITQIQHWAENPVSRKIPNQVLT